MWEIASSAFSHLLIGFFVYGSYKAGFKLAWKPENWQDYMKLLGLATIFSLLFPLIVFASMGITAGPMNQDEASFLPGLILACFIATIFGMMKKNEKPRKKNILDEF